MMTKTSLLALSALTLLLDTATVYGHNSSYSLGQLALGKVLEDASPAFGHYVYKCSNTSTWMKQYPNDTLITHMNLPGTHDTATWNYTEATQKSEEHITDLALDPAVIPSVAYRCQESPMIAMLNDGIRVFDLRYAADVTNTTLVFWHGGGLVSETATVEDTMFGFYAWLDQHPSEAIFLSFQYEGSTTPFAENDADVQTWLLDMLSSPAAKKYVLQTTGSLGTLGEARGKITLFKRFDLDQLPANASNILPGLHFSPANWTDNSPNITLVYNTTTGATAYIEDYYQPDTALVSSYDENVQWKLNATEAHLRMAATTHPDSLFWSFASATHLLNVPPVTPEDMALGNGTLGVNDRLISFFQGMKGQRLGIVMFDFYDQPSELLPLFLSLLPPA